MASPAAWAVRRRTAWNGGVQLTPGETNMLGRPAYKADGILEERIQQSLLPHRPSTRMIAFFLSPLGFAWPDDFIMGHETVGFTNANTPRGRLSTMDDRRNIGIPDRVSYGSIVGESDGVAPYGLD